MNKAELFSKSSRIVERNLGDPDAPLHGILPIEEYTGLSVVAIPYAGTALKVQVLEAGSRRIDQEFKMGLHQILDLVRHLVRSLQLLGPSIDRFMKYVDWGREPGSFTIETDDLYNFMHNDIYVVIFIDLSILYLRIIGDCIGRTLPSLLGDLPRRGLKKGSLREVWNYAKKEPQTPLGELFSTTSMEWFEILARHVQPGSGSREGIRDARFHHGATMTQGAHRSQLEGEQPSLWQFSASMGSVKGCHSTDLVTDIRTIVAGMFGFMDRAVRKAVELDHRLAPKDSNWEFGLQPIFGPPAFIASVLPRLSGAEPSDVAGAWVQT